MIDFQILNFICIIGDTHFGISDSLLESQLRFFREQLIPYLRKRGIRIIIQTGDFFDNRRSLDVYVKNKVFELLENDLKDFQIIVYLGNHDTYYKTSNEVNSLKFLKKFENITVIEEITKLRILEKWFLFVPWLYDLNLLKEWVSKNKASEIDFCFGHFDLIGAKMSKSVFSKTGLTKELLYDFKKVFSGHYHTKSEMKNGDKEIIYVGTPYQLNFGDTEEERGFHILNCDDSTYEFVENNVSIKFVSLQFPEEISEEKIKGNIVNVHIDESENIDTDKIQTYIESINRLKPAKEPIKRIIGGSGNKDINLNELKVKSLKELFDVFVSQIKIEDEIKEDVLKEIDSLYSECQRVE